MQYHKYKFIHTKNYKEQQEPKLLSSLLTVGKGLIC